VKINDENTRLREASEIRKELERINSENIKHETNHGPSLSGNSLAAIVGGFMLIIGIVFLYGKNT
jgi:hypothetical protein